MANLTYPSFSARQLLSKAWIARERKAYEAATVTFVMSQHVRETLIERYGVAPSRAVCVRAGRNITFDGAARERPPGAGSVVLFVGVEWARKGGPALVEAVRRARAVHPALELHVVGCAPEVGAPFVREFGRLPLEAVKARFLSADLFAMPTRREPFGVVAVEAMAAGLPVLLPRLGAFPDFVRPGENGMLHAPDDVDALTAALVDLFNDRPRLAAMGAQARTDVGALYSWTAVAEAMAGEIRPRLNTSPKKL